MVCGKPECTVRLVLADRNLSKVVMPEACEYARPGANGTATVPAAAPMKACSVVELAIAIIAESLSGKEDRAGGDRAATREDRWYGRQGARPRRPPANPNH